MVVALVVVSVAASVGVEGMPSFNWWGTSGETYDDVLDPVASGSGKTLAALDEAVSIQTIPLLLNLTSLLANPSVCYYRRNDLASFWDNPTSLLVSPSLVIFRSE